jgi:hypothetical protein
MIGMRTIAIALLAVAAMPASARMYQWVNPQTGRTQLSGAPPAWYRSGGDGPRVFVFDNGRVIDDTARPVSDDQRQQLRDEAFRKADEEADSRKPKPPAAEATTDTAATTGDGELTVPPVLPAEQDFSAGDAAAVAPAPTAATTVDDDTLAQMKAIIEAHERQKAEAARQVLERQGAVPPQSP